MSISESFWGVPSDTVVVLESIKKKKIFPYFIDEKLEVQLAFVQLSHTVVLQ